jgi:hypothetical protein
MLNSVAQCPEYDRLQRELLGVLEVLCKLAAAQPEAFSAGDAGACKTTRMPAHLADNST